MDDMVPRSRLNAVERELAEAEAKRTEIVDNATTEIKRLQERLSAWETQAQVEAKMRLKAESKLDATEKRVKRLEAIEESLLDRADRAEHRLDAIREWLGEERWSTVIRDVEARAVERQGPVYVGIDMGNRPSISVAWCKKCQTAHETPQCE